MIAGWNKYRIIFLANNRAGFFLTVPMPCTPLSVWVIMLQYVAILRASPEVEVVFRDLDAFIAELQFLGTHAPDGFEASLSLFFDINRDISCGTGEVGLLEARYLDLLDRICCRV